MPLVLTQWKKPMGGWIEALVRLARASRRTPYDTGLTCSIFSRHGSAKVLVKVLDIPSKSVVLL